MTTRTYTTGLIVSAALAISGVLWYQRPSPYVAGEDIAAVLADALELRQITVRQTDFTPTNIVPEYMFLENRYFWRDYGDGYGAWDWQEAIQTTSFTVTAFRAEESIRNATIRLLECVVGHAWYAYPYTSGREFLDLRCPSGALDLSISPRWGTNALYRFDLDYPGHPISNIVFNANLLDVDCSGVTLQDRIVTGTNQYGYTWGGSAAISTPLTVGSIFGGTQRYDTFTNRLAGAESWWTYAGISPISYLLEPVERLLPDAPQAVHLSFEWADFDSLDAFTGWSKEYALSWYDPTAIGYRAINVHRSPFITKEGLNVFRHVLTNMTRTVEFQPACWAKWITYSYSGTNAMVTSTNENTTLGYYGTGWPITFFDYGVMTGNLTSAAGGTTNEYPIDTFSAYWKDIAFTPMSIGSNYYASGQVSRVRFYIATEASTPRYWYPPIYTVSASEYLRFTNGLSAYSGASLAANYAETYGYPVTHGAIPDISLPASPGADPRSWLLRDNTGYFTTNQVWNLIGDVTNPPAPPTFTLAASSHARSDLQAPAQLIDVLGPAPDRLTASWRYHTMRLSKIMMIVDWSITLKSSGGYTNAP
jgi:hypothetical protein